MGKLPLVQAAKAATGGAITLVPGKANTGWGGTQWSNKEHITCKSVPNQPFRFLRHGRKRVGMDQRWERHGERWLLDLLTPEMAKSRQTAIYRPFNRSQLCWGSVFCVRFNSWFWDEKRDKFNCSFFIYSRTYQNVIAMVVQDCDTGDVENEADFHHLFGLYVP